MKFYQTKEFKDAERLWNNLLTITGFIDHERTKNGERVLISGSLDSYRQADATTRETKIQYFNAISHHFNQTKFKTSTDRCIMQLHANGVSIRKIVNELLLLGEPTHRQTVRFVIRRYEHVWGVRFWTLKERNLKYER